MQAFIANIANFVQLRKNFNGTSPGDIPLRTKLSSISCFFGKTFEFFLIEFYRIYRIYKILFSVILKMKISKNSILQIL